MSHFKRCPKSVNDLAEAIIKEYEQHKSLVESKVAIDFVFAYAPQDNAGFPVGHALMLNGAPCLGIARIISVKQRVLGRGDAEVSLDGDWWNDASPEQQKALLDHELHHITVAKTKTGMPLTDDIGHPKLTMRKHDFQFGWFSIIAARHGMNSQECIQARQIADNAGSFLFPREVMEQMTRRQDAAAPSKSSGISSLTISSMDSHGERNEVVIDSETAKAITASCDKILSECDEDEELIQQCIEVIRSEQKASVSLLQRRLRLGYTRAARIMDELENRAIVGPARGVEPRDILIDLDAAKPA